MSCPFPGMDPYLEMPPYWSDFGPSLMSEIRNALLSRLLPRYDVRIEEYLVVMEDDKRLQRVKPDVSIVATAEWEPAASSSATAVAEATSAKLAYPVPLKQRRVRVIHTLTGKVAAVIEILSPWNKPRREGLNGYRAKRAELIASRVNLVEIDLLRGGKKLPMRGDATLGDYCVYIGRGGERPGCHVITWSLKSTLPKVPIPLLEEDGDAELDLAAVFHTAYDGGFYDRRLPYDQPLDPAPAPDTAKWIEQQLTDRSRVQD